MNLTKVMYQNQNSPDGRTGGGTNWLRPPLHALHVRPDVRGRKPGRPLADAGTVRLIESSCRMPLVHWHRSRLARKVIQRVDQPLFRIDQT